MEVLIMTEQQKEYMKFQRKLKIKQQEQLIKQYEDLLWVIVFGLGGICFTTHIHELLGGHKTQNRRILSKMEELDLIDTVRLGNNTLIKTKAPVIRYFTGKTKVATVSRKSVLRSALFCEMYLRIYRGLKEIREKLKSSNFHHFTPEANLNLMQAFYNRYNDEGYDITGLETQIKILKERRAFEKVKKDRGQKLEFKTVNAEKYFENRTDDIYTLSCKNVYLRYRGTRTVEDKKYRAIEACIINLSIHQPKELAELIRDTYTTLSEIFNNVAFFHIKVYTLDYEYTDKEKNSIAKYLEQSKLINNNFMTEFECYKVRQKLFSNKSISQLL